MSVRKTQTQGKPVIDLDGPSGNAFCLLGLAASYLKQLEKSKDDIETILAEMKSGNYDNLLIVFERELGEYVILETENEHFLTLLNS